MKLKDKPTIELPSDVDKYCVDICNLLNRMPDTQTYESCEGHFKNPFWVFFHCTNIGVLSRLGKCVERNYSDGNWEIVVDSCDTNPKGCFWLRTKNILTPKELKESLLGLIVNINHWFKDEFDEHFDK